jgi:hypothetical protein
VASAVQWGHREDGSGDSYPARRSRLSLKNVHPQRVDVNPDWR